MVALAIIPMFVDAADLQQRGWQLVIWGIVAVALVALLVQMLMQSKEDHERERKESKRDEVQQTIMTQLSQLSGSGNTETSVSLRIATTASQPVLNPPVNFDSAAYFRVAYQSAFTEDLDRRIRVAAELNKSYLPPEEFYPRFIGTGLVAYLHDITWAYIFRSQFLMMTELNRRGGFLPVSEAKSFCDRAMAEYPQVYTNYTFDQWLTFIQHEGLVIRHPSEMLEISTRGRDFLAYSGHNSRTADQKRG